MPNLTRSVDDPEGQILDPDLLVILGQYELCGGPGLAPGGRNRGHVGPEQVVDGGRLAHAGLAQHEDEGLMGATPDRMGVVGEGQGPGSPDLLPGPESLPEEGDRPGVRGVNPAPFLVKAQIRLRQGPQFDVLLLLLLLLFIIILIEECLIVRRWWRIRVLHTNDR